MKFIGARPTVDLSYSDVFLLPNASSVDSRLRVELAPDDGTPARLPVIAANMNAVTGPRLAAAVAQLGGLGVLPQDVSIEQRVAAVQWVKQQSVGCDAPLLLSQQTTAAEALRVVMPLAGHGVVVTRHSAREAEQASRQSSVRLCPESAVPLADVLGVLPAAQLSSAAPDTRLGDLVARQRRATMHLGDLDGQGASVAAVIAATEQNGVDVLGVVNGGELVGTITVRSAVRRTLYRPALDSQGRLAVAAAIRVNADVAGEARALVAAGADVLVLDTAHGHQQRMIAAIECVAQLRLGVPIVAGNVVTSAGVRDLVAAGADIVKVGVGPGAMCTTRMMTAVGRPQFSAVLETAAMARSLGAHVWADGGVRYPRDVALALAAGASTVMIGSWFAGTLESPGELHTDTEGRAYKRSWGMASAKAVQARARGIDQYERLRNEFFAEGISESTMYLDEQRPSVSDLIDLISSGVRSSLSYVGAATVSEFQERAVIGMQSAAGYEEGKPLPTSW